jgi:AraC-like DNA-binding protein
MGDDEDTRLHHRQRHMREHTACGTALGRVRALIDTQCSLPLDLSTLSAEAGLSRFHFLRLFRAAFHETPHQYLIRRRIDMAKELLVLSAKSVTDICFEVGFESLGSFSAAFHRIVGWPPSEYRARSIDQRLRPRRYIPNCCWVMLGYGT